MLMILTLLIFCGVLIFSAPLLGGERAKSFVEPVQIVKQVEVQQVKERTISSRISFYISEIKTLLRNWFEPKEPVVDDKPAYDSEGPNNGENDDVVPIKDNGWGERIN